MITVYITLLNARVKYYTVQIFECL
uniref:Uncharacterized protein n=1 Tax=Anguilla anguilla TaxID=7936 RepID=A0A0E9RC45_ANGAN